MVLFDFVLRMFRVHALAEGSPIWRRQPLESLVPECGVRASYQDDWLGIQPVGGCLSASSCKLKVMHIQKPAAGPGLEPKGSPGADCGGFSIKLS